MQNDSQARRALIDAECYTPVLLHRFLADLERTTRSVEVWQLLVALGKHLDLPYVDFICASSFADWKKTLFIRTSYDSTWLNKVNEDPELHKWSYFRSHAMHYLTPIVVGLEFVPEYRPIPNKRVDVLRKAARHGIRAGFSIPLRLSSPPQAAMITFSGDHDKTAFMAILDHHGWTLNTAAVMAHQRYMSHFAAEFSDRNEISDKQRVLLELIGLGHLDKQIASQLQISVSAVRQRMNYLMQKTGLSNRAELAALAMSLGIIPDPLHKPGTPDDATIVLMDK
jgi:DNA-binding CsgD family transcriptional regulator